MIKKGKKGNANLGLKIMPHSECCVKEPEGHRIPTGGGWALSLTFHRWRNSTQRQVVTSEVGAGSNCVKEWGGEEEK